MAVEHSSIVDPNQHEPKGIGSATAGQVYTAAGGGTGAWATPDQEPPGTDVATAGQAYIADGAGGGVWTTVATTQVPGWAYYKDANGAQVFTTAGQLMSNDGASALSDNSYTPTGVSNFWDTTNDFIISSGVGDSYILRVDLPITAKSGSASQLKFQLAIDGATTPPLSTVIVERIITLPSTLPATVSVSFGFFSKATFDTNGGRIFLTADANTIEITNPAITVQRISSGAL
jgi:hypothetical protein